jgi:hypothetical protein
MTANGLLAFVLLWFVLPLWLLAGVGDYLCHRLTRIEETSGPRESVLHIVQFLLIFVPMLMGLFFSISLLMLALLAFAWLLHTAAALWDTTYASRLRHISAAEQHVHSYLELLPLFALVVVTVMHWEAVRARDFTLVLRDPPLPARYTVGVAGVMALSLIPILEEWWRGLRNSHAAASRASQRMPTKCNPATARQ